MVKYLGLMQILKYVQMLWTIRFGTAGQLAEVPLRR